MEIWDRVNFRKLRRVKLTVYMYVINWGTNNNIPKTKCHRAMYEIFNES